MAISLRPDSSDVTSVRLAFISHASEWRLSDIYRQTLYLSDSHFQQLALHDILQRATQVLHRYLADYIAVASDSALHMDKGIQDTYAPSEQIGNNAVKIQAEPVAVGAVFGTVVTRKPSDSVSVSHLGSNSANKRITDPVTVSIPSSNSISRLRADYSFADDVDSMRTVKGVSDSTSAGEVFGGSFYKSLYDTYGYADSSLVTAYKVTTDFAIPLEYITGKAFVKVLRDSVVSSEMFLTDASYNSNWSESASVASQLGMVTARKVADSAAPSDTQSFVIAIGSASVLGSASIGDFALGA